MESVSLLLDSGLALCLALARRVRQKKHSAYTLRTFSFSELCSAAMKWACLLEDDRLMEENQGAQPTAISKTYTMYSSVHKREFSQDLKNCPAEPAQIADPQNQEPNK